MNPILSYCLGVGVKPRRPKLLKSFYIKPANDFIFVENNTLGDNCENLNETLEYLSPELKKTGISIIQLKLNPKDETLDFVDKSIQLTHSQFCFLLKTCRVIITNNSLSKELARVEGTPNIFLSKEEEDLSHPPYWYPEFTFSLKTSEFSEEVAKKTLKTLGLKSPISKIKAIFQGAHFSKKIIEIIPNFDISKMNIKNQSVNIRADYFFDQSNILKIITQNRCNLITKKPINLLQLPEHILRQNLIQINYEVTNDTKHEEVDLIKSFNIPVNFFCRDLKNIQSIRLKFIDEKIDEEKPLDIKKLDINLNLCDNYFFKSSKIIISNNMVFTCKSKESRNQPVSSNSISIEKIFNEKIFWDDLDHYKILTKNND